MDANKKKELRAAYKERKPERGVLFATCTETGEVYLGAANDIPAGINRVRFQLESGLHPNKRLQEAWNRFGEAGFEFGIVQALEQDDEKDDCADDLDTLLELCLAENPDAQRLIPERMTR